MGEVSAYSESWQRVNSCVTCGMNWYMPQSFSDARRKDGGLFYCPAGHAQKWAEESDAAKIKRLERDLAAQREEVQRQRDRVAQRDNSMRTMRGHATRLRKRAAAGVCPCCNRSFVELARHMATKHPSYAKADIG